MFPLSCAAPHTKRSSSIHNLKRCTKVITLLVLLFNFLALFCAWSGLLALHESVLKISLEFSIYFSIRTLNYTLCVDVVKQFCTQHFSNISVYRIKILRTKLTGHIAYYQFCLVGAIYKVKAYDLQYEHRDLTSCF